MDKICSMEVLWKEYRMRLCVSVTGLRSTIAQTKVTNEASIPWLKAYCGSSS